MFLNTKELEPGAIYRYLVGGIVPRPIAWVSTLNQDGINNIAPYSFFTVASIHPPILAVSHIAPQAGQQKDTLANLQATKECVVNIVSHDLAESMNASSAPFANDISEFETLGIASVKSVQVKPLSVAGAKVRYECRLRDVLNLSDLAVGGQLILLDVVGIYIEDKVLTAESHIDPEQLDAIGKMGGDAYCQTTIRFNLARPS